MTEATVKDVDKSCAEALRAVIAHCFETVGLRRLWADFDTRNPNSGKVMQKAGMLYEGTLRNCAVRCGETVSKTIYAILAEDYVHNPGCPKNAASPLLITES